MVWTGGRRRKDDCGTSFIWQSMNVTYPLMFTDWMEKQPDCGVTTGVKEFCLAMDNTRGGGNLQWNDLPCNENTNFALCEIPGDYGQQGYVPLVV